MSGKVAKKIRKISLQLAKKHYKKEFKISFEQYGKNLYKAIKRDYTEKRLRLI